MNNLPAIQNTALDYSDKQVVATLKATVAQGLNDHEFLLFAEHCKATGLNPFKKEVWAIKGKGYTNKRGEQVEGKLQIMTGINGFYEIANRHPDFDGIESGLIDPSGEYKSQAYPKNDFIGAWAKVYHKQRRVPIEAVAMLAEYDKSLDQNYQTNGIWRTMKRVMIIKCADSVALRKAFPQQLNGLYTAEEMPPEYAAPKAEPTPAKLPEVVANDTPAFLEEGKGRLYRYDVTGFPVEKLGDLAKYLKSQKATQLDETLWASEHELKKLKDYELPENVNTQTGEVA